jgi:hypothetical protein
MAIVLTALARVKDWRALRHLNRETLLECARDVGATRYRLYRNAKDASEVLVLAELPDHEALRELARVVGARLGALPESETPDDREWEATDLDGIG